MGLSTEGQWAGRPEGRPRRGDGECQGPWLAQGAGGLRRQLMRTSRGGGIDTH